MVLPWWHLIDRKTKELVVGASEGTMLDIERFVTHVAGIHSVNWELNKCAIQL